MFDMIPFRRNSFLNKRVNFENFINSFFNNDFFTSMNINKLRNEFKVDIKETDNTYLIEADLPGINKESIDLDYNNNYLTISAKRNNSKQEKKENYIRHERNYGEFKRSFYVDNIDKSNISASFENGVLKINLPKLKKQPKKGTKIHID